MIMFSRTLTLFPDIAKEFCETFTNLKLDVFDVLKEQWQVSPKYNAKKIRLDTYARSGNYIFDIEMQNYPNKNLYDRADYYASAIKVNSVKPGDSYTKKPFVIVLFICTFNPSPPSRELVFIAKDKLHACNMSNFSLKDITEETKYDDRCVKMFVNTKGDIPDGCSEKFKALIKYINTGKATDAFTRKIDRAIEEIKNNEEEVRRFMTLQYKIEQEANRVIKKNRKKWKNEGIKEGIKESKKSIVIKMANDGLPVERIARITEISAQEVNLILSLNKKKN